MDWITVIIVLLIIGIIADGLRRVRKAKRESLRLSPRAKELDEESIRVSSSEFPSGGARVAKRREDDEVENLNQNVRKTYEDSRVTVGAPKRQAPEQTTLNLEEVVPMLMDTIETKYANRDDLEIEDEDPRLGDMSELEECAPEPPPAVKNDKKTNKEAQQKEDKDASEVLIISVMAKSEERISGVDLLNCLMSLNLKFGEMDIFHRYQEDDGDGPVYFSLANMVVPGTFNLAQMKEFSTPGVTLFMQLPLEAGSETLTAFDLFAQAAKTLAHDLQGELKDENRSVMTNQTFEHYRQRVIEFERRKKLQHN